MQRIHLFELEDQGWFPKTIRDAGTDFMRYIARLGRPYRSIVPNLRRALDLTGSHRILDLCSGGAGPVLEIREELAAQGCDVSLTLSDKYPNNSAFQAAHQQSNGEVDFILTPVDATAVPQDASGFRTLFSSLHHFRPESAKRMLQDAVDRRQPIAAFEITQRNPVYLMATVLVPLTLWVFGLFVRPFRWSRLLWTYLVPVVPLFLTWDAFVSCLRTYSVKEMQELVDGLRCEDYVWEVGRVGGRISPVSYLLGYPKPVDGTPMGAGLA